MRIKRVITKYRWIDVLIFRQILLTSSIRNIWTTVRRIWIFISGLKGLRVKPFLPLSMGSVVQNDLPFAEILFCWRLLYNKVNRYCLLTVEKRVDYPPNRKLLAWMGPLPPRAGTPSQYLYSGASQRGCDWDSWFRTAVSIFAAFSTKKRKLQNIGSDFKLITENLLTKNTFVTIPVLWRSSCISEV